MKLANNAGCSGFLWYFTCGCHTGTKKRSGKGGTKGRRETVLESVWSEQDNDDQVQGREIRDENHQIVTRSRLRSNFQCELSSVSSGSSSQNFGNNSSQSSMVDTRNPRRIESDESWAGANEVSDGEMRGSADDDSRKSGSGVSFQRRRRLTNQSEGTSFRRESSGEYSSSSSAATIVTEHRGCEQLDRMSSSLSSSTASSTTFTFANHGIISGEAHLLEELEAKVVRFYPGVKVLGREDSARRVSAASVVAGLTSAAGGGGGGVAGDHQTVSSSPAVTHAVPRGFFPTLVPKSLPKSSPKSSPKAFFLAGQLRSRSYRMSRSQFAQSAGSMSSIPEAATEEVEAEEVEADGHDDDDAGSTVFVELDDSDATQPNNHHHHATTTASPAAGTGEGFTTATATAAVFTMVSEVFSRALNPFASSAINPFASALSADAPDDDTDVDVSASNFGGETTTDFSSTTPATTRVGDSARRQMKLTAATTAADDDEEEESKDEDASACAVKESDDVASESVVEEEDSFGRDTVNASETRERGGGGGEGGEGEEGGDSRDGLTTTASADENDAETLPVRTIEEKSDCCCATVSEHVPGEPQYRRRCNGLTIDTGLASFNGLNIDTGLASCNAEDDQQYYNHNPPGVEIDNKNEDICQQPLLLLPQQQQDQPQQQQCRSSLKSDPRDHPFKQYSTSSLSMRKKQAEKGDTPYRRPSIESRGSTRLLEASILASRAAAVASQYVMALPIVAPPPESVEEGVSSNSSSSCEEQASTTTAASSTGMSATPSDNSTVHAASSSTTATARPPTPLNSSYTRRGHVAAVIKIFDSHADATEIPITHTQTQLPTTLTSVPLHKEEALPYQQGCDTSTVLGSSKEIRIRGQRRQSNIADTYIAAVRNHHHQQPQQPHQQEKQQENSLPSSCSNNREGKGGAVADESSSLVLSLSASSCP